MKMKKLFKGLAVPLCVLLILLLCAAPAVADSVDLDLDYFDDDDPVAPHDDIVFSEWTSTTSLPTTAGNYYLKYDVEIDSKWRVPARETNLDLNGHSITFVGNSDSVISVVRDVTLNLYDRVGTGKITGGKGSSQGGGIWVSGTFNMYGGNITGNTATRYGGGIYVSYSGSITMYGGNIAGNAATADGAGGGVYIYDKSTFTMYGGSITDNTATYYGGGGVNVNSGTFTMHGGNIQGNTATRYGGGVNVNSGTFTMHGGNIQGNTATRYGGGVYVSGGGSFLISGSANIAADNSVYITSDKFISILGDEFTGSVANITGSSVYLGHELIKINGDISPASICDRFTLANTGLELRPNGTNGIIVAVKGSVNLSDTPWCIQLNRDVTLSDCLYISSTVNLDLNGYTLRLADNSLGSVVYLDGKNAVLNLYDNSTTGNGKITGGNATDGGGGVYVGGTFIMHGGNITGNTANDGGGVYVDGTFTMYGGNITGNTANYGSGVYNIGKFTLYDGDITSNIADYWSGGVYNSDTFIMYGGNITYNAGSIGGGVCTCSRGTFTMYDGNITGNTANSGGGVYLRGYGTFTMHDGNITDNTANDSGGGVYVYDRSSFSIYGGNITDNTANDSGGGVYAYGVVSGTSTIITMTMHGGNITGNVANDSGGGVYVKYAPFNMRGGSITSNKAIRGGSGVYLYDDVYNKNYYAMNLYDGNITDNFGDGVYVNGDYTTPMNMYGGNITGNSGTGVYVRVHSTFNMYGGNITGNFGKGVYVDGYFKVSGNANIAADNSVYINSEKSISISGSEFTGSIANITGPAVSPGYELIIVNGYMPQTDIYNRFILANDWLELRSNGIDSFTVAIKGYAHSNETVCDIKLNSDITMSDTLYISNTLNLDLNGHKLQLAEKLSGPVISLNGENAVLNIYDNSTTGDGIITGGNLTYYNSGVDLSNHCTLTMHSGSISGNSGGVCNSGTFTMYGGNITGNTVSGLGGGVCVYGTFTMYGGNITENTGSSGGGVCVYGTFVMYGGNITCNTAEHDGGGVVVGYGGTFTMNDGNITGNTATNDGGGVYVYSGTFKLSRGGVINNTVSGMANNVYLCNGKYITVDSNGDLGNTKIGITTEKVPTETTPIAITGVNTRDYSSYFFADKSTGRIENRNNVLYLVSVPSTHWAVQLTLGTNMTAQDTSKLDQLVQKGSSITPITIVADAGYCFEKSNYPNANGLVYTVSSDKKTLTISGTPTKNILKTLAPASESPHSITVSTNGNGTATASPTSAKSNETVTLTATPSSGYAFSEWQVISSDIQIEDNAFTMPFGDVSIKAIFLPEYLVPVEDTTESVNAATAAEVGYRVTPVSIQEIKAPSITRGGRSLVLDEKVVVKVTMDGVEREVEATVNADGTVNVADADIDGADSVSVTFVGRKIGDVSGDGSPNTLDAAMILKASAEIEALDVKGDFYGDVTNDGQTTTLDAARILQHSADMTDDDYELIE